MHMWSLRGLVCGFLDLTIAYLLLCASALALFASKFLGFFGLNLPCPCDGFLCNTPYKDFCLNRLLVDVPAELVANVQLSVCKRFPFSSSKWARNYDLDIARDYYKNGILEIEGDASSSSISIARTPVKVIRRKLTSGDKKYGMKGKGLLNNNPRSQSHRRRKVGADRGNDSSDSSYDRYVQEEILGSIPYSQSSGYKNGKGKSRQCTSHVGYEDDACHVEYMQPPLMTEMRLNSRNRVLVDNSSPENSNIKRNVLYIEELRVANSLGGEDKNFNHVFEKAFDKELSSLDALYIELERERIAASSAAEEAMAMILRLQEEKASMEIEARQYQRILEEKSSYEAEEMNILEEILVRREKEKYSLEKEVEVYRQMMFLGNQ